MDTTASVPAPGRMPPLPGYRDATEELLLACSHLRLGQMVTVAGFTLMDSMSAIQIMDARMDSGMELPAEEIPETDRIPPSVERPDYDVFQPLDASDVIWIMDRLLACEASWHLGRALSQTIYTCLYFHDLKSLSPHQAGFSSRQANPEHSSPPELVWKVLRSFILATVKACDLVWNELTKQNVYDGEDFSSDKSGLSLLEGTDPMYAIAQLDDAVQWLSQAPPLEDILASSLKTRLTLRKQTLLAIALLADRNPATLLEVSIHCRFARRHLEALRPLDRTPVPIPQGDSWASPKAACRALQDPSRSKAPSLRSMASFDPAYNRKLVASAPLRPVALPSAEKTWAFLDQLLEGLQESVQLMQKPSMLGWKMFFSSKAYDFQTKQTSPYVRSLYQSAVCDRNLVAGRLPLDWLAEAFFNEFALVDPLLLRRLARINRNVVEGGMQTAWNAPPSLGQAVNFFTQRLAGHLASYLSTLCQNRSRQKRALAKAYAQWTGFAEEASELGKRIEQVVQPDDYVPDSLFVAIQHAALDITLQVCLSGFELELYRRDEWSGIYFVASKISSEQATVCSELCDELTARLAGTRDRSRRASDTLGYLRSQAELSRAIEAACIGTIMLLSHLGPSQEPRPWPLSQHESPSSSTPVTPAAQSTASLVKATFVARVKWLEIPNVRQSSQSIENLWEEYSAFRDQIAALNKKDVAAEAEANFSRALQELRLYVTLPPNETKTELCRDQHRQFVQSLLDTCQTNLNVAIDLQGETTGIGNRPSFSRHKWIPTFC